MRKLERRHYLLTVLLVIQAFNNVDGQALAMVLQNIKGDLHLSDSQLGVLTGIAFALFYSVMGIPIGRWADRGNRVQVISVTTALWSVMVVLCGTAMSFGQLLLIRVGVAVGEAGCIPPAHSLIADYFTRAERPRAVSFYLLGGPLSLLVGYLLAGWLNEFYGWRFMFMILGIPGLGLAALAWFTLREPRLLLSSEEEAPKGGAAKASLNRRPSAESEVQPSLKEISTTLWSNLTFRHLLFCYSLSSFFGWGVSQWQPTFLIRSYGLTTGELGTWLAIIYGTSGFLGTYWGGTLASRYAANNERRQLKSMAVAFAGFAIVSTGIYLSRNEHVTLALIALSNLGFTATIGTLLAIFQTLVRDRMRATSIAVIYFCANLIGMGLGPLMAGTLSDVLRPLAGEESLRYALLALCPGYFWAGWHLWRASRTVARDVERAQCNDEIAEFSRYLTQ